MAVRTAMVLMNRRCALMCEPAPVSAFLSAVRAENLSPARLYPHHGKWPPGRNHHGEGFVNPESLCRNGNSPFEIGGPDLAREEGQNPQGCLGRRPRARRQKRALRAGAEEKVGERVVRRAVVREEDDVGGLDGAALEESAEPRRFDVSAQEGP